MHFPKYPIEWIPEPPWNGPPLPLWATNPKSRPWLPIDLREELEQKFGHYATQRAEAMIGPAEGVEAVRTAARSMADNIKSLYGIGIPAPPLMPKRETRGRPRREGAIAKAPPAALTARIPAQPILTEGEEEELLRSITDYIEMEEGKKPGAKEVATWAEEQVGKKIPLDYATLLIKRAKEEMGE